MDKIKFISESHKYYCGDKQLISVSEFTERFKEKQNWEKILQKKAKSLGISRDELKRQWDNKSKMSVLAGNTLHLEKELTLANKEFEEFYSCQCKIKQCEFDGEAKYSIPINQLENNTAYPELMIYDLEHGICGQSDKVIVADNTIHIWDFKGLALNTDIPTLDGFKKMEYIQVGDIIFDGEGFPTRVQHISEIHYNKCYEIQLDTNDTIVSDHEHKWEIEVRVSKNRYKTLQVRTDKLIEMFNEHVPIRIKCSSLSLPDVELPIDPYVLGIWLGDGNSYCGRITNMNDKIWKEIENRGYNLGHNTSNTCGKAQDRTVYGLYTKLKKLNLLKNKHIPNIYLRSSYKQRLELLRGFMDADGYWHKKRKRSVMITTKEWQADAICNLVSSLGWKPTKVEAKTSGFGRKNIKTFHVNFDSSENPFLSKNEEFQSNSKEKSKFRYIKTIREIGTVPTKCISVESECHTYLATRNYIKTHNTDKEISFKGYSNQFMKARKLLKPIDHLEECNGNIYSIKMSLYMYMLWKANKGNLKPGELVIEHVHLKRNEEGYPIFEDGKPIILKEEIIKVPYRKREVESMLKYL